MRINLSKQGYIKLHRQLQDCLVWDDKPFNMGAAWVDLLLLANHEDKETIFDKKPILVKRGQRITSVRILSDRWGWGNEKTLKFLRILESQNMITRDTNSRRTLITIVNYDIYQGEDDNCRTQTEQKPNTNRTLAEHSPSTNKNDKNDKNDNNDNNITSMSVVEKYNEICVSFPKCIKLTDKRKQAINARLKKYTFYEIVRAFELMEKSDFLKGANNRNWNADFDWIMNDSNLAKVLEQKYNKKESEAKDGAGQNKSTGNDNPLDKYDEETIRKYGLDKLQMPKV